MMYDESLKLKVIGQPLNDGFKEIVGEEVRILILGDKVTDSESIERELCKDSVPFVSERMRQNV